MSFDEEHLDDHYVCRGEIVKVEQERDEYKRRAELWEKLHDAARKKDWRIGMAATPTDEGP